MDYTALLSAALADLEAAVKKLEEDTTPTTPMPRVRGFEIIASEVVWPASNKIRYISFAKENVFLSDWRREYISNKIIEACHHQPRLILRALRRIQAATAWCEARAEGRQRAAEGILRQQAKAVEALEAEAAMLALK